MLDALAADSRNLFCSRNHNRYILRRKQERSAEEGVDGLLRDRTRPPGRAPRDLAVVDRVVALTLAVPPAEATHWTGAMMAKVAGISVSSVQRIWRAHGLVKIFTRF